ncbi:hypothetical protein QJS10_CPA06g02465 [Acorus calamus]|uniref:Mitochondrial carrier protein n=1 Tax=Acorus calamus TaxID=4465 RepID=A0AAV9ENE0_ACOCL|nr:hypothetical protein QJS10_CPA06g02465 [Acorus calamus]
MSLAAAAAAATEEEEEASPSPSRAAEIHLPADIDWQMLDKSRFFFLGAALFSGVSFALYPVVVLKTRQQICRPHLSCFKTAASIVRHEGFPGFYRGFGTSLTGTIPARALYMAALEITKSGVGTVAVRAGVPEPAAATVANAAAGLSAAVAAQLVWTPIDVISQRLMVPDDRGYRGGVDAFRKIVKSDGLRGLYRGFGMSILTYAPSNAVWWASYSVSQRLIWGGIGCHFCKEGSDGVLRPDSKAVVVVQGASAALAGGMAALITMPLDTIKTRMQVMDSGDDGRGGRGLSVGQTVRSLLKEGGWTACYRGLGPRWASMSVSATTMITTYEFLKRLSTKRIDGMGYE